MKKVWKKRLAVIMTGLLLTLSIRGIAEETGVREQPAAQQIEETVSQPAEAAPKAEDAAPKAAEAAPKAEDVVPKAAEAAPKVGEAAPADNPQSEAEKTAENPQPEAEQSAAETQPAPEKSADTSKAEAETVAAAEDVKIAGFGAETIAPEKTGNEFGEEKPEQAEAADEISGQLGNGEEKQEEKAADGQPTESGDGENGSGENESGESGDGENGSGENESGENGGGENGGGENGGGENVGGENGGGENGGGENGGGENNGGETGEPEPKEDKKPDYTPIDNALTQVSELLNTYTAEPYTEESYSQFQAAVAALIAEVEAAKDALIAGTETTQADIDAAAADIAAKAQKLPDLLVKKPVPITLTVRAEWMDNDNQDQIRPFANVFVTLVNGGTVVTSLELTEAGGWQGSYEIPAQDAANYQNYTWIVAEGDEVVGYNMTGSYINDRAETDQLVETVLTYVHVTHTVSKKIVVKWSDENNKEGLRPNELKIGVQYEIGDTKKTAETVTVNAAGDWTATVSDLPVYQEETHVSYEWDQSVVPEGYELSEVEIGDEETVFTYTCLVKTVTGESEKTIVTTETEIVEEKVPAKTYQLTIRYWTGSGRTIQAFPDYVGIYSAGSSYNVKSPAKAGYTPNAARVTGTLNRNRTIHVNYTANPYILTVQYRYMDGSAAAPSYQGIYRTGSAYNVTSPVINGYTASYGVIAGNMPGRNASFVVYYSPVERPALPVETVIEDYKTPLGLGTVTVNAGECFE